MENENKELEVDSQNTSEETEETTEETSTEDQTSQKGDAKYSENEKQLYERAKKAEAKAKRLEHLEKKVEEKTSDTTPVEEVAKTVHALKDYSAEEVETIFRQAKVLNVSPLEAIKNEDVALLIEAKRAKVAQESKTPEPTNRQDTEEKDFSQWSGQDIEKASMENLSKYYDFLKKKK